MYIIYSTLYFSINFASFSFFRLFLAVLVQRNLRFSVQSCQDCWVKFKYVFKIVFLLKEISFFMWLQILQDLNTDNENRTLYNLLHVSHLYVYYIFYIIHLINFASFSFFSPFLAVLVQRKLLFSVQSCQDCWVKFKYVF